MTNRHRRTATVAQSALTGAGVALLTAAVVAIVRAIPPVIGWATRAAGHQASGCGCGLGTPLTTGGALGAGAILLVALAIVGSVLWRGAAMTVRTRRFIDSLVRAPRSAALDQITVSLGLGSIVDEVSSAKADVFCGGLFRPRIFVSSRAVALLDDGELRAVLMHERYHQTHRHPLLTLVADAVTWSLRQIPGLRQAGHELHTILELAADESAIDRTHGPEALGRALLKLLPPGRTEPAAVPAVTFFATTDRRIDHLLGTTRNSVGQLHLLSFTAMVLGLATLLTAMTVSLKAPPAAAGEVTIGQCREVQRTCPATRPIIQTWMSTDVQLVSTP
ncbi:MAG: M56 family metallopeptidase [Candidatus Kerfeldbacteria bacterium]|nr:M56 family metallopeptidase [Candidatus Kerfeldbacteria bacterium]